jgi:hypothetical protein
MLWGRRTDGVGLALQAGEHPREGAAVPVKRRCGGDQHPPEHGHVEQAVHVFDHGVGQALDELAERVALPNL